MTASRNASAQPQDLVATLKNNRMYCVTFSAYLHDPACRFADYNKQFVDSARESNADAPMLVDFRSE
ncbi:hypothetical protein [Gulosibacter bifidus]|uniref:Uncharacterized protein n=1 Tax=Gulosibacter bifidus TaxID=272239 RepID=A0ABW5RKE7_9MICO|nr:hypothetical protein [Gulosibacter bifidus]